MVRASAHLGTAHSYPISKMSTIRGGFVRTMTDQVGGIAGDEIRNMPIRHL